MDATDLQALVDSNEVANLKELSNSIRSAGFDHLPAYSILRGAEDAGEGFGLRKAAHDIRELHGGIYRAAAKLWALEPEIWNHFPTDPIPRSVWSLKESKVIIMICPTHLINFTGACN